MFLLAAKSLLRNGSRTLLCVLGVAVTGGLLLDMAMLANGLQASIHSIIDEMGYHVRLAPKGTLPFETEATIRGGHAIAEELRKRPEVADVGCLFVTTLYAQRRGRKPFPFFAAGLEENGRRIYRVYAGADLTPGDPHDGGGRFDGRWTDELVVNRTMAEREGLRVGERVTVAPYLNSEGKPLTNARTYTVRGIADFRFDLRGQYTAAMPISEAQDLKGKAAFDAVSLIVLRLKRHEKAGEVAAWIRQRYSLVETYSTTEVIRRLGEQLFYFKQFSLILSTVSMAVSFLLVLSIVTMSFNERVGEIAILRAIGFRSWRVGAMVVWEGLLLSAFSAPPALAIGMAAAQPLDAILRHAPSLPQDLHFFVPTAEAFMRTLALLLVTGAVAAVYPAWLAARLRVAETMHKEVI